MEFISNARVLIYGSEHAKVLISTLTYFQKHPNVIFSCILLFLMFIKRLELLLQEQYSGASNDGFLSDPLKDYFMLSGLPLKLCLLILGCAIFLSVRSF